MGQIFNEYNKPTESNTVFPVTVFVYASPRVGDEGFKNVFNERSYLHLLRIKNKDDCIPNLPLALPFLPYVHVGEELDIDSSKSPFLNSISNPCNLDIYLHGIAGYKGESKEFTLVVDYDIALANKHKDGLMDNADKYKVPSTWWVNPKNNGMIQKAKGYWELKRLCATISQYWYC